MEIKTFNPFTVLYFTKQITMAELFIFVRTKARELYTDALHSDLEIVGPVYWIYYGMDGNPETIFTLEIALPITEPISYQGNFAIKKLNPFKCISAVLSGSWENLPATYGTIFGEIGQKAHTPSGECREIYLHMDFNNPENNITEIQVGIR
jgi:effector-binding domain-containing protein